MHTQIHIVSSTTNKTTYKYVLFLFSSSFSYFDASLWCALARETLYDMCKSVWSLWCVYAHWKRCIWSWYKTWLLTDCIFILLRRSGKITRISMKSESYNLTPATMPLHAHTETSIYLKERKGLFHLRVLPQRHALLFMKTACGEFWCLEELLISSKFISLQHDNGALLLHCKLFIETLALILHLMTRHKISLQCRHNT